MTFRPLLVLSISLCFSFGQASPALRPDPPKECDSCAEWNTPLEPFRVFGNTYYVGPAGVSAMLITSPAGHILVDGALTQSAVMIDANIRKLGFRTEDIKLMVNGHAHYDHTGAFAALQGVSGAPVAASPLGITALQGGNAAPDDPQMGYGLKENSYPPVTNVRAAADGETLRVGELAITAHHTPGHTPGSTSWTWTSCEGARCLDIVYADSLSAVAAPGFRFTGDATHPSIEASFRASIAKVAALPCDVFMTTHPQYAGIVDKAKRRTTDVNPFIDSGACRAYAAGALKGLEARLAEESGHRQGEK